MIFVPKPPPTSGATTSTLNSGRPKSPARPFLMGSGACVESQTLSTRRRASHSATTPRASIGHPQLRSIAKRSRSTRGARASAASASPTVWRKRAARLSGTSPCTRGVPGASAVARSVTTASGSYVTSISAIASSAM